jgi:hypothetical protein
MVNSLLLNGLDFSYMEYYRLFFVPFRILSLVII